MNKPYLQIIHEAALLLGNAFNTHIRESKSKVKSLILLGASTPGMVADLIQSDCENEMNIHLIEPTKKLTDSITAIDKNTVGSRLVVHNFRASDLKINPDSIEERLRTAPCCDLHDLNEILTTMHEQTNSEPFIEDNSIDVVVMDMLLNRLTPTEADKAISESFRVLSRNGKLLMTVLLADEYTSTASSKPMINWSAINFPIEMELMRALEKHGYHAIRILNNEISAIAEHGQAELNMYVIEASKGKQGVCLDQGHTVIFRGPWSVTFDDDGHKYVRGERTAVCAKTYALLTSPPYSDFFIGFPSRNEIPLEDAPVFDCSTPSVRDPRITKGTMELQYGTNLGLACC